MHASLAAQHKVAVLLNALAALPAHGHFRFAPNVRLDPSQVEDRRWQGELHYGFLPRIPGWVPFKWNGRDWVRSNPNAIGYQQFPDTIPSVAALHSVLNPHHHR